MTLEQLRIFVAVAERQHVTQAAQDLNLTQSATSSAVAALEERYQTKLFDRVGRRIALTDAGKVFLTEAKAVLARANAAETLLTDLAALRIGSLTVAASQTVANYWLPLRLAEYHRLHPAIEIRLTIGNTEGVAALTREGVADIGLVEGNVADDQLNVWEVDEDELVLVVGKTHPWASRDSISSNELVAARWVMRELGSGTRMVLEEAVARAGGDPARIDMSLELPSNEAVRSAVEAGAGAAVLSSLVTRDAVRTGNLIQVPLHLPRRKFFGLRHRQRHTTRAAQALVELLTRAALPSESRRRAQRTA